MSWGRGTVYVRHCEECGSLVKKSDKEENEDLPCPADWRSTPVTGAPAVSYGSHKQEHNYPHVAPNLPGDGVVTSWNDYQSKLKKSGQYIKDGGTSNESRARSKDLNRKPKSIQHKDFAV
jgi:hypothetical protein